MSHVLRLGLRRISTIALLACAGSIALLHAQNSSPAKEPSAPSALPAAPDAPAANGLAPASAFRQYQRQAQPLPAPPEAGASFNLGSPLSIDPFRLGTNFVNLPGSTSRAWDFDGQGTLGAAHHGATGFNQFGSFNMSGHQGNPASLFPVPSAPLGATPQPSLSQLMSGTFNLPLNSPSNSALRFQYSGVLMPAANLSDLARPYGSTLFTSSDLGNGVFLSAGTYNSSHSMAGAPAASLGNGTGAPKHSASGVAINLSF
jgi:hypothetical protein